MNLKLSNSSIAKLRTSVASHEGFTLLEVMIAIGVLAIGIGAILVAENNSLDVTLRAKRMTTVATLAKNTVIEAERELEGKTFDEVKEDANGKFDAPYTEYSWDRKIREVTFPNLADQMAAANGGGGDSAGGGSGGGGGAAAAGAGGALGGGNSIPGVERVVKIATNYLSKSSREITVTIQWTEKKEAQSFTVSQYWVDLNHEFNFSETP